MHYRKRAQCIADKYEKASRTKRTLKQVQTAVDRLHEELSGERLVRATVRSRVASWLQAKKPEMVVLQLWTRTEGGCDNRMNQTSIPNIPRTKRCNKPDPVPIALPHAWPLRIIWIAS